LLLVALAVALVALLPLVYLVIRALGAADGPIDLVLRRRTVTVLANTLALSIVVGAGAAAIGLPLGWLTAGTDLPGRRWWTLALTVPLAVPSYVLAFALIGALGPSGAVADTLARLGVDMPSIYGFWGAALVLVLATYPYVMIAVRAALRRADATLLDAARSLGDPPATAFRRVILPLLVPAISAGVLLSVLYALGDFGSVSLLQFDSFARAIHIQYRAAFDRSLAAVLALMLAGLAITVAITESWVRRRQPAAVSRAAARPLLAVPLGRWRLPSLLLCGVVVGLALVLPIGILLVWFLRGVAAADSTRFLPDVVGNTLAGSGSAAFGSCLLAIPLAVLVARWPGRMATALEATAVAAYALPGIVVALAVVFLASGLVTPLYQTFLLLAIAYSVRFLPLALGPLRDGLGRVSPRIEESARMLGRGPIRAFVEVTLPQLRPAIVGAAALVFLTTAKELPMTLILGPTGFGTLATAVWSAVGEAYYARAAAPGLLLIIVSVAGVGLLLRAEEHL
jgi:iron(III) transport system permease protein